MKRFFSIFLFLIIGTAISANEADRLTYITENYAPFNYKKEGQLQGIFVDLLEEMLVEMGSSKRRKDIKLWPWAKGYSTAMKQNNTILFGTVRTKEREDLFKWVGPLAPARIVLTAKRTKGIKVEDPARLEKYRVVAVRKDVGDLRLIALGAKTKNMFRVNSSKSAARMLLKNKADLWAYEGIVALWNIQELGYPQQDFEAVSVLDQSGYYFAFNKQVDQSIIELFQGTLDQLKKEGKLKKIISRYIK